MSIDYYNQNADEFFENTVNVDMSELYERFTRDLPSNAKILDAGCGSGRDTKAFLEMGYSVEAFDASEEMVKRATEYTRVQVKQMTFEQVCQSNHFNGIWCCASLLHVPKHELKNTFNNLSRALKSDGLIYVSFKYGSDKREVDGRAFTDLSEESLIQIVSNAFKLNVADSWLTTDRRPNRSEVWLNALLTRTL